MSTPYPSESSTDLPSTEVGHRPGARPQPHVPPPSHLASCPGTPWDFFHGLEPWLAQFVKWSDEVNAPCFAEHCLTREKRRELEEICRTKFHILAVDLQTWANGLDACFLKQCPQPPGHTKPPPPPF